MPAANIQFPWMSYYGNYNILKRRIKSHSKVSDVIEADASQGLYHVVQENRTLKVFICECYCFGVAEYEEVMEHCDDIDAVIINSTWCFYTDSVKEYCKEFKVGVFNFSEFFGAINRHDFWNYLPPEER